MRVGVVVVVAWAGEAGGVFFTGCARVFLRCTEVLSTVRALFCNRHPTMDGSMRDV